MDAGAVLTMAEKVVVLTEVEEEVALTEVEEVAGDILRHKWLRLRRY